jgi:hypothetical protein
MRKKEMKTMPHLSDECGSIGKKQTSQGWAKGD